jgi:PAS domain S-box-containing protein
VVTRRDENSVLVVNDEPEQLALTSVLLRRAGYNVLTAAGGREGFEAARRSRPDLVISDVSTPGVDGIELCRMLRALPRLRLTPVLLMSAHRRDSESVVEGLKAGADDYLEIPYDPARLVAKVARLLERKRSEGQIKFQAGALSQVSDAVIAVDNERRITYWNGAAQRLYGFHAGEVLGRRLEEVNGCGWPKPEDEQAAWESLAATGTWHGENTHVTKDGKEICVDSSVSVLRDECGRAVGLLAVIRDITERRRAERDLRRQKEILQKIFDHIPIMVNLFDAEGRLILVNREWEHVLGWTLEEAREMGLPALVAELYPEPSRARGVLDYIREENAGWSYFETRVRDGRVLDTAWATVRLSDGSIIGIGQDITERKRIAEELKQGERLLAEAQRLARVGSWSWDAASGVATWSDEMYRIFGLRRGEVVPGYEATLKLLHPEDRAFVAGLVEGALRRLENFSHYARVVRPDGQTRVFHFRVNVVADERGQAVRMFGTAQDVTERRLAEERLRGSNEKLRALAARLQSVREEEAVRIAREIHDELGGALTGLKFDFSWLARRLPEPDMEEKRRRLEAMSALIDETIRKVRSISTQLRPSVLDDLGLAAAIEWQAREFESRTEIECRIAALEEGTALSPEKSAAVFRIFQEILTNVARHSGASRVEISLSERGGSLVLTVSDNGVGVKESEIADTKSLGLLGMRERALVFGGGVSIRGEAGRGTTVTVSIPHE